MKDARISVRLPLALRRQIKDAARRAGVGESEIILEAVERQFAASSEGRTAYDLANKAGIIGIVRDLPRDLSTNPKHFDGFGK